MKMQTHSCLAIAGAIVSIGLSGCCGGKIEQCNKLISAINSNGEAIKTATDKIDKNESIDTKATDELAKTMDTAADNIRAVELKDEKLRGFAAEYEKMLRAGASAARDMSKAASTNDADALKAAVAEIDKAQATESGLVTQVNAHCQQ